MASPQDIRKWLIKMQYPDPNPSDEALQRLCRGAMGPIFQQIIDRVKPKQEVEQSKKAIIVHKIIDDTMKLSSCKVNQSKEDIDKLKLYHEKRKLEKELQEINAQNIENEATLEHLKAKIKLKNAKYQTLKEKLRESEKDIVLFKAKKDNLQRQIHTCQQLHAQSRILERTNKIEVDALPDKIKEVLSKLYDIISSYNRQLSPTNSDLTTISENSTIGRLHTSSILSSNKKPLSSIKKAKQANSTRKNLAEITNNHSLLSSTLRKKNLSKISFTTCFNSTVSSTNNLSSDKHFEAIKELEQICCNDKAVMKLITEIWESDCEIVFKFLLDLKENHKNKIADMIARNNNGNKDCDLKSVNGIEKLFAFHIENEMKRMICEQERNKIEKMLNSIDFKEDIRDLTVLKATEFSLENAIEHARNSITKLQQDLPDNSDKLTQILDEIQKIQTEMTSTKSKIDSNLSILRECNSWMDKHQKNIFESLRKPQQYSEYELLQSNIAEQDAQNFVNCPFQLQNTHYFDSWAKIYSNPELLEIIQFPFLSADNSVQFFFDQKKWLHQLQMLQGETNDVKLHKSLALVNVNYDEMQMNNSYKQSVEQLKASSFVCSQIMKRISDLETELKYFVESPLNDCVAHEIKYENKTLKEYCEIYDSYYKQLM